jgi:uncharacterized membrane protein
MAMKKRALARALGLGAVAGMRSLAAPAILSRQASSGGTWANGLDLNRTPFDWMGKRFYSILLGILAAGELGGGKSNSAPPQTRPLSLALRAGSGALAGAAVFAGEDEPPLTGALLGAGAALIFTFAFHWARQKLAQNSRFSPRAMGLGEDLLVGLLGSGLLKR